MHKLNVMVVSVPGHSVGSSYWILPSSVPKFLGHIFWDDHPPRTDREPGWIIAGGTIAEYQSHASFELALDELLSREGRKRGIVYRMKSEEWAKAKKGGKI